MLEYEKTLLELDKLQKTNRKLEFELDICEVEYNKWTVQGDMIDGMIEKVELELEQLRKAK
jgi:hypothetical protein